MTSQVPLGPRWVILRPHSTPPYPIWKTHRQRTNCIIKNHLKALEGAKMSGEGITAHGGASSSSFLAPHPGSPESSRKAQHWRGRGGVGGGR